MSASPHRPRRPRARVAVVSLATVLAVSACRSGGEPELVRTVPSEVPSTPASTLDTTATSPTGSTAADPTATGASPPVATIEASPSTTIEPVALPDRVAALCETLTSAGLETRAAAVDEFESVAAEMGEGEQAAEQLEAACGAAASRARDAIALLDRRDQLDATDDPVSLTGFRCADGEYRFVAENNVDHPIGVHVALRLFSPSDDLLGTADYPIVIWELEPDARQGITGTYTDPGIDGLRCNLLARVFVAGGDGDAAIPGSADPELTGDDPNDWFGVLLGREVDAVGSGDPDAASLTEDIRSTFYDDVMELNLGDAPVDRVPTSVTICNGTVDRPDDDHVSFVYFVTYPAGGGDEGFLRHGLFRRGSDGQWRWLSAAHSFDSPDFYGCGRPGPQ
ncbi:MAG: hypothetical protein HKN41_00940 [Ilumatobacter sp.]|nr:hypothetical protein [Ilumatobacter sp.]